MSQQPPSVYVHDHEPSLLQVPGAQVSKDSADFFPVPLQIEEYMGVVQWVDGPGVLTCGFQEPLVHSTESNSEIPDLQSVYLALEGKLNRAIPWHDPKVTPRIGMDVWPRILACR